MTDQQVRVTFQPHGRAVFVLPGTKVLEAAGRCGLALEAPCGGRGLCGKCRVQFTSGPCEPGEAERKVLTADELAAGWRLACQTAICSPCVIHVPPGSLFASQQQILTAVADQAEAEVSPAVRKVHVTLRGPSLREDDPDALRLEKVVGPFKADLSVLRQLPGALRGHGCTGTAVLSDHRLIDFEPGDTTGRCFGIAFDIGTTTLVGSLLNLCNGEEVALASRINPQVSFGDDVLSRIRHASQERNGLLELRKCIRDAVAGMVDELCEEAKVERHYVYEATFAGNTTMQHLLCGLDVAQLGHVPFVPACGRGLLLGAGELGVPIHPRGSVYVYPVIGGFVGGDTVAGILATQLVQRESPAMMVDIGTNGEIVLACDGKLWAASTAAGPAFEGARISCGMRATAGAIEKIVVDDELHVSVIGGGAPMGLCGSALIDLAADLLDRGALSSAGRLLPPVELPPGLPDDVRRRVTADGDGVAFLLAETHALPRSRPITVTQRDFRELQLATGAIRAGVRILLKQAGLKTGDLKCILIAGGFGSFIRRSKAQRIGLLPGDVHHERIRYVGNTSLNGARWALLSTNARIQAEKLARQAVHVELSQDPQFQTEFADAMIFPQA